MKEFWIFLSDSDNALLFLFFTAIIGLTLASLFGRGEVSKREFDQLVMEVRALETAKREGK